ncbi:MAG: hypothetical protein J5I65_00325 [Aridibacter famidurans]|nr:hypothetical protein [Aridibacter famidurans]
MSQNANLPTYRALKRTARLQRRYATEEEIHGKQLDFEAHRFCANDAMKKRRLVFTGRRLIELPLARYFSLQYLPDF